MHWADKILALIEDRGTNLSVLAEKTGIPRQTLDDKLVPNDSGERKVKTLDIMHAWKIAQFFGVPLDLLADPKAGFPPTPSRQDIGREDDRIWIVENLAWCLLDSVERRRNTPPVADFLKRLKDRLTQGPDNDPEGQLSAE